MTYMLIIIRTVLFLFFMSPSVALAEGPISDIVLADFEDGILCSQCGDNLGYRTRDASFGSLIDEGAEGSAYSARFMFDSRNVDLYFQGNVRRKFLATGAEHYQERGHNALSFWIKVPENSAQASVRSCQTKTPIGRRYTQISADKSELKQKLV